MKKIIITGFLCFLMLFSSTAVFAEEAPRVDQYGDWLRVFPDSPFPIETTDRGLYTYIEYGFALGFCHKDKVDCDGFTIEFTMDEIARYDGKSGFNMWYGIGLEDETILENTSNWIWTSTGIFLLISPRDEETTAFSIRYKVPDNKDLQAGPETKLPIKVGDRVKIQFKNNEILVNGTKIDADPAVIAKVFEALNGKAHPFIAAFNSMQIPKRTSMTIHGFNNVSYEKGKETTQPQATEPKTTDSGSAKTDSSSASPKTGDAGMVLYLAIAGVSGAAGLLVARRKKS